MTIAGSFFPQLEALNLPWKKKQVDSKLKQLVRLRHLVEVDPNSEVWGLMGAATHGNEKIKGFRLNPLSPLSTIVNN